MEVIRHVGSKGHIHGEPPILYNTLITCILISNLLCQLCAVFMVRFTLHIRIQIYIFGKINTTVQNVSILSSPSHHKNDIKALPERKSSVDKKEEK